MQRELIATKKLVALLILICAGFMLSVFIARIIFQPPAKNILQAEEGTLFPVPRDIKSFHLTDSTGKPFTQKNLYQHWTLLFFGFTHCASVCPANLALLDRVYEPLQKAYPNLQVVLVSLDPARDDLRTLNQYVMRFNAHFVGVTGKLQDIHQLQSQLGIYSAKDNSSSTEYQLQHTASILLINPEGKWAGLFPFGSQPAVFQKAVLKSIASHTSM